MNIQFLNGGLANQVFQYIFAEYAYLASPGNEPWYLDDSFFFVDTVHNGYELSSVFGLHPLLLSEAFEPDLWEYLLNNKRNGMSVPQSMKTLGFPVTMIAEYDNYKHWNPYDGEVLHIPANGYLPELAKITAAAAAPGSLDEIFYLHGYHLNPGYFNAYREHFLKQLSFRPLSQDDSANRAYEDQILSSHSVGVHIRRGDYVSLGFATDASFYKKELETLRSREPESRFFIFSDDIDWCRTNAADLGLFSSDVYIEGNLHGRNWIDLYLMSLCSIIVFGRSSFAQLATMLDTRLEYCVSELG